MPTLSAPSVITCFTGGWWGWGDHDGVGRNAALPGVKVDTPNQILDTAEFGFVSEHKYLCLLWTICNPMFSLNFFLLCFIPILKCIHTLFHFHYLSFHSQITIHRIINQTTKQTSHIDVEAMDCKWWSALLLLDLLIVSLLLIFCDRFTNHFLCSDLLIVSVWFYGYKIWFIFIHISTFLSQFPYLLSLWPYNFPQFPFVVVHI